MAELLDLSGERVLRCDADGPLIDGDQQAADLIGEAFSNRATLIAVPISRLGANFFDLRSGVAGVIAQKVVVYHVKLAIVGDVSAHMAASGALRDWVRECDRSGEVYFVPDFDELAARLSSRRPRR